MNRKKMIAGLIVMVLVPVLALVTACGQSGVLPGKPVESARIQWAGYTMGIDQVTDDQDKVPPLSIDGKEKLSGKMLKVCFCYLEDDDDSGGFVSSRLFDDLRDHKIVLKDSSGNTYEQLGFVSDITMKGGIGSSGFGMADTMPRFSIGFDVPADSVVEDYTLSVGGESGVPLATYTSQAYAADHNSADNT